MVRAIQGLGVQGRREQGLTQTTLGVGGEDGYGQVGDRYKPW